MQIFKFIPHIHLVNQRLKLHPHIKKYVPLPSSSTHITLREAAYIAKNTLAIYQYFPKIKSDIIIDIANTHVEEDQQKIVPNFVTQMRRKKTNFPKTYYDSDDENALLEKQEAVYIKHKSRHPFYNDFIISLNTHLQGYNICDTSETFAQRIADFSIPLNQDKKLFRGMGLSKKILDNIELTLAFHHIPSIKSMAYHLLHYSKGRCKITSVSTLPEIAQIFAFQTARTLKKTYPRTHDSYFPVCLTLECDKNAPPPKGLTFPVNKIPDDIQWIKNKNEHEIILDGNNNEYQITDIHYDAQKNYYKIIIKMNGVE